MNFSDEDIEWLKQAILDHERQMRDDPEYRKQHEEFLQLMDKIIEEDVNKKQ